MSSEVAEQAQDLIGAVAEPRALARRDPDRRFQTALAVAALLHASLLIGATGAPKKRLGEADGSDEAINVSLVTEADFLSRTTVPENAGAPKGTPVPPTAAAQPAPPPEPAKSDPPATPEAPSAEAAVAPTEREAPDLFSPPDPAAARTKGEPEKANPADAKAPRPAQKPAEQRTAKLDLSTPKPSLDAPIAGGRSAGVSRPPGITRSGANDDFARAVIRALQQTMPQLRETIGRVTVRIILNENGNIKDVQVVRPSPNSNLNQSVAFAARQTSYPFPPLGSNEADRIFLVTYIYN